MEAAVAACDTLRVQLAQLRRLTFGRSSEKLSRQIEQLALEELEGEAEAVPAPVSTAANRERAPSKRTLPDHLPRIEQRIEPTTAGCACPACGGALRPLGSDSDEMLDLVPVQWRVVRVMRPKYSCRSCERIVQADAPAKTIARGKATFATLAHVVVAKYSHHLPLYRQAEMMAAQGLPVDRSTLAGWAGQAAALLDPIYRRIREEGLKAAKIHADDTPVPMLLPGKGKTATARLWTYVVDNQASGSAAPRLVWYRFTPDRSGLHPQRELETFAGLLQADGYAGYDRLYATNRVTEVACWAHFRRKIFENHQVSPTPLTTDLLERIRALYKIEDKIRGLPPEERRRQRQERSKPLIDDLRTAIDDALRHLSPKSAMAKALLYGRKRWVALTRILKDGRAEIDNSEPCPATGPRGQGERRASDAERSLRSEEVALYRIQDRRRAGCRNLFHHRDLQA